MPSRLPSTRALLCFTAVAKTGSVTRASEQLSMTQSAVSRQINALENQLGVKLFRRHKQRLQLTPTGGDYAHSVADILDQLQRATQRTRHHTLRQLRVGIEPALVSSWLIPQLDAFNLAHPEIDLQLITDMEKLHPVSDNYDLAVLYGNGDWPGMVARELMQETLVAVCAPRLKPGLPDLERFADILAYPLIHHRGPYSTSDTWLVKAGCNLAEIAQLPGPRLETFGLVMQCALQGLGLAVLPTFFVQQALGEGTLVAAGSLRLPCEQRYHLVIPEANVDALAVKAFAAWLSALPAPLS